VPCVDSALIALDDGRGNLSVLAELPGNSSAELLMTLVRQAVPLGVMTVGPSHQGHSLVLPFQRNGRVQLAVALILNSTDPRQLDDASARVRWGIGWLLPATSQAEAEPGLLKALSALDLLALSASEPTFEASALEVLQRLCLDLQSDLVQLGWMKSQTCRIVARSNTAWHQATSQEIALAEAAMIEATDQGVALIWPEPAVADFRARIAVKAYASAVTVPAVMVVPLKDRGRCVGALLLERQQPFSTEEAEAALALGTLLGPVLKLRHQADESVWGHLRRKGSSWAGWLTSARGTAWKLAGSTLVLVTVAAAVVQMPHRVSAPAVLEGQTQRVAVAPFAGYILEAGARAGDVVRAGHVLARMDDKDLLLEKVRWESELELATRREREALAQANRAALRQLAAQAAQARAQLELVKEKLTRQQIVAPFDATVVKGDLSQSLGAPVETGKVLFELAPLEAWRVIVKVDERDIGHVQAGQGGQLRLGGTLGKTHEVVVERVQSVGEAEDGRNLFRVEARLAETTPDLRPGMEGVAKLEVGEASVLWVWTHRFVDWARRTAWEWAP
jgi:biotin carboxyl carrier protein